MAGRLSSLSPARAGRRARSAALHYCPELPLRRAELRSPLAAKGLAEPLTWLATLATLFPGERVPDGGGRVRGRFPVAPPSRRTLFCISPGVAQSGALHHLLNEESRK